MKDWDPFDGNPIALSEDDQRVVQAWVDQVKPMLGLTDWAIRVSRHRAERDAIGTSFIRDNSDLSVIALDKALEDLDPTEVRQTLTHELLHCHFQPVTLMAEKLIAGELGKRTEAVVESAISQVEERTIDRLATAIARFLPMVEPSTKATS